MFDDPKKELDRLQEQLLAAETRVPEEDFDDGFNESDADDILDNDLYAVLYDDQDIPARSAGFDTKYEMKPDRYVAVAKKKKKWLGDLLFAIVLIVLAAATLIGRWQGWLP